MYKTFNKLMRLLFLSIVEETTSGRETEETALDMYQMYGIIHTTMSKNIEELLEDQENENVSNKKPKKRKRRTKEEIEQDKLKEEIAKDDRTLQFEETEKE